VARACDRSPFSITHAMTLRFPFLARIPPLAAIPFMGCAFSRSADRILLSDSVTVSPMKTFQRPATAQAQRLLNPTGPIA